MKKIHKWIYCRRRKATSSSQLVVVGIHGVVVGTGPASLVCGAPMVVAGIRGVNRKNACVNVM